VTPPVWFYPTIKTGKSCVFWAPEGLKEPILGLIKWLKIIFYIRGCR
jgi:hypothetical protein